MAVETGDRAEMATSNMSGIKKTLSDGIYIVFGICLILLLIMKPHIVLGLDGDNCAQTYALFTAMARTMHTEGFRAWNPYLWGGFPNVGNFITESCYPVNWILCHLFYDSGTGVVSYAIIPCNLIFHLGIYFTGMYFLLKKSGFSRLNAFSVGLMSALCGSLLHFMYWLVFLDGFCWLPFLLLAATSMFEAANERKLIYAVVLGVLFTVEASVSISLMLVISVFLFGIFFVVAVAGKGRECFLCNLKYCILSGVLALLLSAPMLLSALTFMRHMVRCVTDMGYLEWGEKIPLKDYFRYIYDFPQFLQMLSLYPGLTVSLSPFVLFFYPAGLFSRRKGKRKAHYISLFGSVICGLACFGIVMPAVFYYIPGLNQLREAVMYGILVGLFGGIVAAEGVRLAEQAITEGHMPGLGKVRGALLAAVMAVLLGYNALAGNAVSIVFIVLAALNGLLVCAKTVIKSVKFRKTFFAASILGLMGVCTADLYRSLDTNPYTEREAIERVRQTCANMEEFVTYTTRLDPDDGYYRMTGWGYLPVYPENIAAVTGFYDVKGYLNPLLASGVAIHTMLPLEKKAQLQNIKYYLVDAADDPAILNYFDQSGHYVKAGEIRDVCSDWAGMDRRTISVYQAQDNLGDAWVVSDYIWNDTCDREEILQRISEEDFRMDRNVFVDRCELGETEKRDLAEINPEAWEYSAAEGSIFGDGIRYHVNTDTSGILVTAELAYPGWEVCVNGEKRTTLTVDGTNRGVVVPAGESEVEFLYRPWELRAGMALQLLAVAWIGALLVHAVKNRGVKHAGGVPCFRFCRVAGRKEKSGRQGMRG